MVVVGSISSNDEEVDDDDEKADAGSEPGPCWIRVASRFSTYPPSLRSENPAVGLTNSMEMQKCQRKMRGRFCG